MTSVDSNRISSGNPALDDILHGGLDAERVYLIEGKPGTGKTTLALQFLMAGARKGERTLYIALSETERELALVAKRHGWSLEGIEIFQLSTAESALNPEMELTVLHPAEIELNETVKTIFDKVDEINPVRIVIDSLSEIRLLAQNPLRYRRQVLALKHFFSGRKSTVILLDDLSTTPTDAQLHSMAHGVILLEQTAIDFGAERRRLRVVKMRGSDYRSGYHDFTIKQGGLCVYPRLVASEHRRTFTKETVASGNADLDALLGGGMERGTSTLLLGTSGVGKSSVALQYIITAAKRGERVALFAFDEALHTMQARAESLQMPLQKYVDEGLIYLQQIDPAELSPGEFASIIRKSVEDNGTKLVVIDSLNGYMQSMPDERFLMLQMHELLSYLGQVGVLTIMVLAQHGLNGATQTPIDLSYLSDAVMLLRYFEAEGRVRRAMSVVKKRTGRHEQTIREFTLGPGGLTLGPPLPEFTAIFGNTPHFMGKILPSVGPVNK